MNVAVSVSIAQGSNFKANKYGVMPLVLNALNGALPKNAGILDGTVANNLGLIPGGQYVLSITFRGEYVAPDGTKYPNYNYVLVTKLGQGFESMVAQKVVESMDFGFGIGNAPIATVGATNITPTPTPTQTPIQAPEELSQPEVSTETTVVKPK
jgi:hypothetical protein